MLNLTWEKRQISQYHKNKHSEHLWIWDGTYAHICLSGTNKTKPQLESRLITSADAEGVTSHISQLWLLYDFNLGVTLLQNAGRPPFPPHAWGFKKKTINKKIPLNHFALPLKFNPISNTGLRFNCRNWIKNIFREVLVCVASIIAREQVLI